MNSPNLEQSISKAVAELDEKVSELQQELLDIAEGKRPIETWNDVMSKLCIFQRDFLSSKLREIAQEAIAAVRVEEIDNAKYSDMYYDNPYLIKEREGERMFNAAIREAKKKEEEYVKK